MSFAERLRDLKQHLKRRGDLRGNDTTSHDNCLNNSGDTEISTQCESGKWNAGFWAAFVPTT